MASRSRRRKASERGSSEGGFLKPPLRCGVKKSEERKTGRIRGERIAVERVSSRNARIQTLRKGRVWQLGVKDAKEADKA
jgi:hypothetical protein